MQAIAAKIKGDRELKVRPVDHQSLKVDAYAFLNWYNRLCFSFVE